MQALKQDVRKIYTVSEVTKDLKSILEDNFSSIWIYGEVSNFKRAASGHCYFTLKDENAQLSGVVFKPVSQKLKFDLEDGLEVILHGRLTVYEPRGAYQIIADYVEPKGLGALQLAFEQLKGRLEKEGLFDAKFKKPLPNLPQTIGIITSLQGAVIHDLKTVLTRRFPNINMVVCPVRVQGEGSALEIATAIWRMNEREDIDILIVGRGGGSLEDLWAFNEEVVIRAIFASTIPVISAVGHESDFTLADFVADLRAPTPSAAAELAVPEREELQIAVRQLRGALCFALRQHLRRNTERLAFLRSRIRHPKQVLESLQQKLNGLHRFLVLHLQKMIQSLSFQIREYQLRLQNQSPLAPLERGYGLLLKAGRVLVSVGEVASGDAMQVRMRDGMLHVSVTGKEQHETSKV